MGGGRGREKNERVSNRLHPFEHTINISNAKVNSILSFTDTNKLVNVFVLLRVVSLLVDCGSIQNFRFVRLQIPN